MADPVQVLLGILILWAPGLAWTWAIAPELDWAKFTFTSIIVALSVQPAVVYVLNAFFALPISPLNVALIALALTAMALAVGLRPRLERLWG